MAHSMLEVFYSRQMRMSGMHTSREGKAPTAEVKVISHTDVLALLPLPVVTFAVSSTDTVRMLGMFSRPVRISHAEAFASISVDT